MAAREALDQRPPRCQSKIENPKSKILNASLCFLSAAALVSQMLGVREVLALTGGNELVLGLVFGAWFFWSGVGAALAGWLRFGQSGPTNGDARAAIRWCLLSGTAGWLPLLQVVLLRFCAGWLETGDGRLTGIWRASGAIWLLLAPPPLFCGACFAALAAARSTAFQAVKDHGQDARATPQVEGGSAVAERFSWDAIGAALAGALFSFVIAGNLSAIQTGLLFVAAGGLFRVCFFWKQPGLRLARSTWLLAIALALLGWLSGWAGRFEGSSLRWRPRFATGQEELIAMRESRYQQLLLAEYRGQYTVYGDGEALATYPDRENAAAETHFVACQAPRLRHVLVAGAAPGSTVRELLRWGPERIDVVEFDAAVLPLVWDKLEAEDRAALRDPAVRLHTGDVARFLGDAPAEEYDLIWLHPPPPTSIQTNRFYTTEFFRHAARALSGRGVLTFTTTGAPNYLAPVMLAYLGSIREALKEAFPVVRELPGSEERFLAARESGVLPSNPEDAVARFERRGLAIPRQDFAPEIFFTMWEPEHEAKRAQDFEAQAQRQRANTNMRPSAMLAYLDIWNRFAGAHTAETDSQSRRQPALPPVSNPAWPLAILAALALLLFAAGAKPLRRRLSLTPPASGEGKNSASRRRPEFACVFLAWLSGVAAIALELCLLDAYQAACGHVYERLALVSGLYMLGLAVGNHWAAALERTGNQPQRHKDTKETITRPFLVPWCLCGEQRFPIQWAVIASQFALLAASAVSAVAVTWLWDALSPAAVELLVGLLILAFAIAAGVQLPLLAALAGVVGRVGNPPYSLAQGERETTSAVHTVGSILAADYAGATLGALTAGTFLIPWLGISLTLVIICSCAVLGLAVLATAFSGRRTP